MGRGKLTESEIEILQKNPFVKSVSENRIVYTENFKKLFIKEYFEGHTPMEIFEDAGFEVEVIGSKRIERASARWRELNASGHLGEAVEANKFYKNNRTKREHLKQTVAYQKKEFAHLKKEIEKLQQRVEELETQQARQHN